MYITLESDYAIRIVLFLAKAGKRVEAKRIAEETSVTLRFSLKILRKLVSSGMVKSFKGVGGGYELGRSPEEISLYDIIHVIEGHCFLNRCLDDDISCNRHVTKNCAVRRAFAKASDTLNAELSSVTMDTLIEDT